MVKKKIVSYYWGDFYMLLNRNEEESAKEEKYISPSIRIIYCLALDVITDSRETGGQWPWGTGETGIFE